MGRRPAWKTPAMRRLAALAVILVLLAASCAGSGSSPARTTKATTTTQDLWLGYYDWQLKENVDNWTTNCIDIQEHFDYIHNIRDGLKRKYGMGSGPILSYLYPIGKRMGCEDFD
jgi:hypothetical protein